jgi:hypothetical protein
MPFSYMVRASRSMLRHPRQSIERLRGRIDRRADQRAWKTLGVAPSALYEVVADWGARLHLGLGLPWPCPVAGPFSQVWDQLIADLTAAGARIGLASYRGWNDGDRALAEAIWCIIAHRRPASIVETGVAHGLTSRVILKGLERNGSGHLWSVDLPAVDPTLHPEIGMAVPTELRSRWSYVQGTSRDQLPRVLAELEELDLFVHDSLHTGRNTRFELESAWGVLRPGGVAVIDDIDRSLGFRTFVDQAHPSDWLAARHVLGTGLWGVAVKATPKSQPHARSPGAPAPGER